MTGQVFLVREHVVRRETLQHLPFFSLATDALPDVLSGGHPGRVLRAMVVCHLRGQGYFHFNLFWGSESVAGDGGSGRIFFR